MALAFGRRALPCNIPSDWLAINDLSFFDPIRPALFAVRVFILMDGDHCLALSFFLFR